MRIEKCINGHFYDAETYPHCPYCNESQALTAIPSRFQKLGYSTFLGSGSTSQVYRITGEREYALKIVKCGDNGSKYQNTLYELRIMEKLRGESHAVQLCDYEIVDEGQCKTVFILEEYCHTLSEYLSGKQFRAADLLQLAAGICDSLIACRELGILHLDVQPKNIFVDHLSQIKLGDFSHSLFAYDAKTNRISRGTLAYMAPEVYRNGDCSEQSDIYSLGLILYSLFHDKILPFMDTNTRDVSIYKRLAGTPFPEILSGNKDLQSDLNRIISKACSFDSADRYASFSDFKEDLALLLESVKSDPEKNIEIYDEREFSHSALSESSDMLFDADSLANTLTLFETESAAAGNVMLEEEPAVSDDAMSEEEAVPSAAMPEKEEADFAAASPAMFGPKPPAAPYTPFGPKPPAAPYTPFGPKLPAAPYAPFAGRKPSGGNGLHCRSCGMPLDSNNTFCPYCGSLNQTNRPYASKSPGVSENPDVDIKKVEFSAIAPRKLASGDYTIINVVMYEESSRHIVNSLIREMDEPAQESRSGIHEARKGSSIKVVLESPDIVIEDNVETGIWRGDHLVFSFAVFLPEEYKKRQILFIASVYINDVIACKLKFIVKCSSLFGQKIVVSREDVLSAFVSYASQDRNRVAAIIQGMKKARPDMDIFFDVDSLRSGDDWEKSLYKEIEHRDILFLCWSHYARDSKWVDAEWRYALERKGAEYIEPIPIEPPDVCPPPTELNHKHFNDKMLYIIGAARETEN